MKILFIGEFPPPSGGITILVELLYSALVKKEGINITKIDFVQLRKKPDEISLPKVLDNIISFFIFTINVLLKVPFCNIVTFHTPSNKIYLHGLWVLIISKFFNKWIVIRKFGGTDINSYSFLKRKIALFVLRYCDSYLCETKELVKISKNDGVEHTYWFPNHRNMPNSSTIPNREKCKKIIFLGLVRKEKGVEDLCNALKEIKNITLDIYGPLYGDIKESFFEYFSNVSYRGALKKQEIFETLRKFDALILPSYREGYPGVILEAFGAGLPVIASGLSGIKEIVDNGCGILVEPGDIDGIRNSIVKLTGDENLYLQLQKGAKMQAKMFSVEHWANEFINICRETMERK